jgi:hypothetical protein
VGDGGGRNPASVIGMKDDVLTELGNGLVSGSLTDEVLLAETAAQPNVLILPDANVIKDWRSKSY